MFSNPEKNVLQLNLPLGASVADFGSGSGHHAKALAKAVGEKGHVYAIDVQKDLLVRLKNEAQKEGLFNIETIHGDLEKQNGSHLRSDSLDAVIASNILFQVSDKQAVLREGSRILVKGGVFLVIDWNESAEGIGPTSEHLFSKKEAEALLGGVGFQVVKEIDAGLHHYGLIARKV